MNPAQLINQDSGKTEYYTPQEIIQAARRTMEGIDLDPFSSWEANLRVGAATFFDILDDSLNQNWSGRVWMNHPFSRELNTRAVQKLVSEYAAGRTTAACCITFASTSEAWFRPLLRQPQCFLSPRTNYVLPGGGTLRGVTKGSVVTYFGPDVASFAREFSPLGEIKIRFSP